MKKTFASISLPTLRDDALLSYLEGKRHVPFPIKRIYFISECVASLDRGHHAHKKTYQAIFCLRGSFTLLLDNGHTKKTIFLDKPNEGVEIPPLVWHEMKSITSDAILLVVASEYYKEQDYIRDYKEFLSIVQKSP